MDAFSSGFASRTPTLKRRRITRVPPRRARRGDVGRARRQQAAVRDAARQEPRQEDGPEALRAAAEEERKARQDQRRHEDPPPAEAVAEVADVGRAHGLGEGVGRHQDRVGVGRHVGVALAPQARRPPLQQVLRRTLGLLALEDVVERLPERVAERHRRVRDDLALHQLVPIPASLRLAALARHVAVASRQVLPRHRRRHPRREHGIAPHSTTKPIVARLRGPAEATATGPRGRQGPAANRRVAADQTTPPAQLKARQDQVAENKTSAEAISTSISNNNGGGCPALVFRLVASVVRRELRGLSPRGSRPWCCPRTRSTASPGVRRRSAPGTRAVAGRGATQTHRAERAPAAPAHHPPAPRRLPRRLPGLRQGPLGDHRRLGAAPGTRGDGPEADGGGAVPDDQRSRRASPPRPFGDRATSPRLRRAPRPL